MKTKQFRKTDQKEMLKIIITSILVNIMLSCTAPRYVIISENKDDTYNMTPFKRYVMLPDFVNGIDYSTEDSLLIKTAHLLKKEKWNLLEYEIRNFRGDINYFFLYNGLSLFFRGYYVAAEKYFNRVKMEKHECLISLLKADCFYELNGADKNYDSLLSNYQEAIDCTSDKKIRKIIKTRIKLIRYGR